MKNTENDQIEHALITQKLEDIEIKYSTLRSKVLSLEQEMNARFEELTRPNMRQRKQTGIDGPLFIPEVDYLVQSTLRLGDFRRGNYNLSDGRASMGPKPSESKMIYGHYVEGGNCIDVLIPYPALKRDLENMYGVSHKHDYRSNKHRTVYMDGVLSGIADKKIKGTTSAQVIAWDRPITQDTIQRTREYWENMPYKEAANRICSKETMLKVLDLMEEGRLRPGLIPWVVTVERFSLNPLISPKQIALDESMVPSKSKDTKRPPKHEVEYTDTVDTSLDDIDWDNLDGLKDEDAKSKPVEKEWDDNWMDAAIKD